MKTNFQRGDILKLSQEGLDFLYRYETEGRRQRASQWRFEYRCRARNDSDCITVKKLPQGYYHTYHESFLELA